jgi:hypothetical protein
VDRADPENRRFKHPDPIGWTEANRPEILRALYTILLGNPTLDEPSAAPMKTRFKMWWRLILLCHKLRRMFGGALRAQHGQRGRIRASATINI